MQQLAASQVSFEGIGCVGGASCADGATVRLV